MAQTLATGYHDVHRVSGGGMIVQRGGIIELPNHPTRLAFVAAHGAPWAALAGTSHRGTLAPGADSPPGGPQLGGLA
jgi:hypothetical protein